MLNYAARTLAVQKSELQRLCLCSRLHFWKGFYLQLSDKSDNMMKYLIDFFCVLGYIGENSAISDPLGPRSKIMLIFLHAFILGYKQKIKSLGFSPSYPNLTLLLTFASEKNCKASKTKYIYGNTVYEKNCILACLVSDILFAY